MPGVGVVMSATSARPLGPVVEVDALRVPSADVQVTATPDTGFPDLSTARTLSSKLAPAITAAESGLAFANDVGGPALDCTCIVADAPVMVACSLFTRTVSPIVHVVVAAPLAFVVDDASAVVPPPAVTIQVTVMFGTPTPLWVT